MKLTRATILAACLVISKFKLFFLLFYSCTFVLPDVLIHFAFFFNFYSRMKSLTQIYHTGRADPVLHRVAPCGGRTIENWTPPPIPVGLS